MSWMKKVLPVFVLLLTEPINAFNALTFLVFSLFLEDSMTHLVNVQYELTQREDLNLTFVEPRPKRALEEIRSLSGVLKAEGFRDVPANLVFKHY